MTGYKVAALALLLAVGGCATKTQVVTPNCTVPPKPSPPEVTADELAPLPDDVYYRLLERDGQLQDAVLERQAMLVELCKKDPAK